MISTRRKNMVMDILALPVVAAAPRRSVAALGDQIPLHYEFRRWIWRTERCVEIALAKRALAGRAADDVLEIGNVLQHAGITGHTVVDKYERAPGVLNVDIMDYEPGRRFPIAISISTLEHVGWDETTRRDPGKAKLALQRVAEMADQLLITIPVGCRRDLERDFIDGPFDEVQLIVKTSRLADWTPLPLTEREAIAYASPYANGNGILVGSRGLLPGRG